MRNEDISWFSSEVKPRRSGSSLAWIDRAANLLFRIVCGSGWTIAIQGEENEFGEVAVAG
ncbi:hypothetical protein USDA257_c18370 [Sinorhizobium fredii USDA 257]|uniref:Uncharacterized protein n=1 Tax=Sinorhizobium fredii (strain USDA 257) TaxID=1185652 RepID=I3X3G8_SINF2|nr:hypothetical protein USDA257_c18370 [Sinorhizobium fredii USDA 257]